MEGTIFKIESKDYYLIDPEGGEVRCSLRGKFQKEFALKKDKLFTLDIAAVGDLVEFEMNQDGSGVINKILPRRNYISRKAPKMKGSGTRGERLEQIIASNIDNLVIVASCKAPKFNNRQVDRLIVTAESSHLNIIIVLNKTDLDKEENFSEWSTLYRSIGYKVFEVSALNETGLEPLRDALEGSVSLIWGASGVGKSSILNKLYPFLDFKVGEVSEQTSKGKHTTVTSILRPVNSETSVIDTPGIREIDPYGIRKEDLFHYFPDFTPFADNCRFNTCTHYHEPSCSVAEAVEGGLINVERYQSYLNILETIEQDLNF